MQALSDAVGSFTAFGQTVVLERLSPLIRSIHCSDQALSITESLTEHIGGSLWLSSLAMCCWLTSSDDLVQLHLEGQGKGEEKAAASSLRILELGAGLGLPGLFASARFPNAEVRITDGAKELVDLCNVNIESNHLTGRTGATPLEWGDFEGWYEAWSKSWLYGEGGANGVLNHGDNHHQVDYFHGDSPGYYDVILGCDCVYRSNGRSFIAAVMANLNVGGKLVLINPRRDNSGIDTILYELAQYGDMEIKDFAIEFGSFKKWLLLVQFTRTAPTSFTPSN